MKKHFFLRKEKILWNFNASMLRNFCLDLTYSVKIQTLVVNVYFGNNGVMVNILKTRIEYLVAHSLFTIKVKSCNSSKTSFYRKWKSLRMEYKYKPQKPWRHDFFFSFLQTSKQKKIHFDWTPFHDWLLLSYLKQSTVKIFWSTNFSFLIWKIGFSCYGQQKGQHFLVFREN